MLKIKTCPFCGSKAVYIKEGSWHKVFCDRCYISPQIHWQKTKRFAVDRWNSRVETKDISIKSPSKRYTQLDRDIVVKNNLRDSMN